MCKSKNQNGSSKTKWSIIEYWKYHNRMAIDIRGLQVGVADPGGPRGPCPPGPVEISHKKDGHQWRPHRFHVSQLPSPNAASGSAIG